MPMKTDADLVQHPQNLSLFSKEKKMPKDTWIDTVHFAKIEGGQVSNVISNYAEALLDFRLTENSTVEHLEENLNKCMESGVTYKIVSSSTPVVMDPDNKYIQAYKNWPRKFWVKNVL